MKNLSKNKYVVVYFGEIRSFYKNFKSHNHLLKNASKIIISTWEHEKKKIDKMNLSPYTFEGIYTKFKSTYFEEIGEVKLPKSVKESEFGKRHFKAMLPKHYLMYQAYKYLNKINEDFNYIIVLRPDLFFYHNMDLNNLFLKDSLVNTKLRKDEFSDQFFAGNYSSGMEILKVFKDLEIYWKYLNEHNYLSQNYINEGFLNFLLKYKCINEVKIDKFFEINRGRLHMYRIIFVSFGSLKVKNRIIQALKKIGLWRSY